MSKRFPESQDEFQHKRGQKDGSHGALPADSNEKYREGFDAGRFDDEKNKFGETFARALKAERDFVRKMSKKEKKKEYDEPSPRREAPLYSCPICGEEEEYDGYYCLNCGYDDDDYDDYEVVSEKEEEEGKKEREEREKEEKRRKEIESLMRGTLYISKYTSPQRLKKLSESGEIWLYNRITFVPPSYWVKYKCDRCGHEWDDIQKGFGSPRETQDCRMGCSRGANGSPLLLWLFKIIKGLITGKEPFGYGRLIKSEEL